jgi:ribosome-binding factor A
MVDGRRPRRVAETIRKHVAEAVRRELFDPRLEGLLVTRVEATPDLATAHLHFRTLRPVKDPAERREIEAAANRAAKTLRRGLGVRLGTKKTPELIFVYDQGQDAIDRVEELLGEIAKENSGRPSE